ncbi:hypothetical 66.3 kDa protein in hag2 5'region [Coriobacteriaceae bacterium EMTCatB1]|nr:hypothetical 66.3 kDa protein in hag2 5'region [Coriobacteriaceae bacterium EMTCatB1]
MHLADDLVSDGLRNRLVRLELHHVGRTALGARPQVGRVTEHVGERDARAHDLRVAAALHALDVTAAARQVAHDVAHELLGRVDLHGHDRLEKDRARLLQRLFDRHRTGHFEGHLRRVDLVVRAVHQLDFDVDHRVASEHAGGHGLLDALVHGRDVLFGDHAAHNLVLEHVALAGRLGRDVDDHVAVLAATAGLPHELAFDVRDRLAGRLTVRDLRLADVRLDLELAHQAVDDDLQVQLAHAGDDRLTGLLVGAHPEGRVLLSKLGERLRELVLLRLRLRFDGDVDDGVREHHRFQQQRRVLSAQRVASRGVLEPDGRDDVTRVHGVDVFAMVRVHLEQSTDALLVALRRVEDVRTRDHRPRVHAEVGELADVGVGHDLERESCEGLARVGETHDLLSRLQIVALDRGYVQRRGQVVDDGVEQGLDALVLERRPARDRRDGARDGCLPDRGLELVSRDLLVLEELREQLVVLLGRRLDQLMAVQLGLVAQLGGNLADRRIDALVVLIEEDRVHFDEVDDASELVLRPDRDLKQHGTRVEAVTHHLHDVEVVGARAVHLVDVRDARHAVAVGLAPDRLGLRLDAAHRAEDGHRAVEDAKRPLHFHGEVHVAGRVYDLDAMVLPVAGGRGRGDGDAALLLLDHPVHRRRTFVDLADLVRLPRVVEDALGRGRLAGVDMGHDPDVAGLGERILLTSHRVGSLSSIPVVTSGSG